MATENLKTRMRLALCFHWMDSFFSQLHISAWRDPLLCLPGPCLPGLRLCRWYYWRLQRFFLFTESAASDLSFTTMVTALSPRSLPWPHPLAPKDWTGVSSYMMGTPILQHLSHCICNCLFSALSSRQEWKLLEGPEILRTRLLVNAGHRGASTLNKWGVGQR